MCMRSRATTVAVRTLRAERPGAAAWLLAATCAAGLLVSALLSRPVWGQEPEYAKQMLCELCHKTQQGAVAAVVPVWAATKHGQATGDDPRHSFNGEPHVGCQACHGPGSLHVKAKVEDKKTTIHLPTEIEGHMERLSVCGRCHAQYQEGFVADYKYGENIFTRITLAEPTGGLLEQVNELKDSKHFATETAGTCIDCHTGHKDISPDRPHQLRAPVNELCGKCHADHADMKHALAATDASLCSDCHLPNGKHTFKVADDGGTRP